MPIHTLANTDISSYLMVLILVAAGVGFAVINLVGSYLIGPKRSGQVKGITYESGMNPVGTARKRFNVRFYLIAMVFLVFDIEIIFLYPWAVTFSNVDHGLTDALTWLGRILFFILTTIVAYVYGLRKGVFKFD